MKTNTKKMILISLCLIIVGIVLTGAGMLFGGRPGVVLTRNGISSPYTIYEPYVLEKTKIDKFSDIKLKIGSYADIQILPSEDKGFYLEYQLDGAYGEPSYSVKNNTLTLSHKGNSELYGGVRCFYIGDFSVDHVEVKAYITLYIPEGADLGNLDVYNDSGDVYIKELGFGDANLQVSYGNLDLQDVSFQDLDIDMECGIFNAKALDAQDFLLKNEYGDVSFERTAVQNAEIQLESGEMKADDFTCVSLTAEADYGNVEAADFSAETADFVMETGTLYLDARELTNLSCKNEYGDVRIRLPKDLTEYSVSARCEYGKIELPQGAPGQYISSDGEAVYQTDGKSEGKITIKVDTGDIIIN